MTVHDVNRLLSILTRLIIDKGKAATLVGAAIAPKMDALDATKLLKQLLQVVLRRCWRDV